MIDKYDGGFIEECVDKPNQATDETKIPFREPVGKGKSWVSLMISLDSLPEATKQRILTESN